MCIPLSLISYSNSSISHRPAYIFHFSDIIRICWRVTIFVACSLILLIYPVHPSANLFRCLRAWPFFSGLFYSNLSFLIRVGPLEPLPPLPGGHPLPSTPHHRRWAMWQPGSSAHYHPCWDYRTRGTVEQGLVVKASCQGFLSLRFSLNSSSLR